MLSWDGRFLHLSDHLLQSWSLIPEKLHFDINVGLSLQFLYVWAKAMGYTGAQLADSAGVSVGKDKPSLSFAKIITK